MYLVITIESINLWYLNIERLHSNRLANLSPLLKYVIEWGSNINNLMYRLKSKQFYEELPIFQDMQIEWQKCPINLIKKWFFDVRTR